MLSNIKCIKKGNLENYAVVCGCSKRIYRNEIFGGASIVVKFGSAVLDLRKAIIKEDCNISLKVVLSNCEIILPENINIFIRRSKCKFGRIENKVKNILNLKDALTIFVFSDISFGKIEIK